MKYTLNDLKEAVDDYCPWLYNELLSNRISLPICLDAVAREIYVNEREDNPKVRQAIKDLNRYGHFKFGEAK